MFQYLKCRALDNHQVARKILLVSAPRDAMLEGKAVRTSREWCESQGADIMEKVITAKYDQVKPFRDLIMANSEKVFIEASRNPIWGCGIPLAATEALQKGEFEGLNLFGKQIQRFVDSMGITPYQEESVAMTTGNITISDVMPNDK